MANCLYCDKELIPKEGKREKKFCNDKCRTIFWAKHNNKKEPKYVQYSTFKELQEKFNALVDKNAKESQNKPHTDTIKEETTKPIKSGLEEMDRLFQIELDKIKSKNK